MSPGGRVALIWWVSAGGSWTQRLAEAVLPWAILALDSAVSRSAQVRLLSSPTRIPVASRVSKGIRRCWGRWVRIARMWARLGIRGCLAGWRGSLTRRSRAGFGSTPAKSRTSLSVSM